MASAFWGGAVRTSDFINRGIIGVYPMISTRTVVNPAAHQAYLRRLDRESSARRRAKMSITEGFPRPRV